jgi:hypothetical protein
VLLTGLGQMMWVALTSLLSGLVVWAFPWSADAFMPNAVAALLISQGGVHLYLSLQQPDELTGLWPPVKTLVSIQGPSPAFAEKELVFRLCLTAVMITARLARIHALRQKEALPRAKVGVPNAAVWPRHFFRSYSMYSISSGTDGWRVACDRCPSARA